MEVLTKVCNRCGRILYAAGGAPCKRYSLLVTITEDQGEPSTVEIEDLCQRCAAVCLRAIDRMVKRPQRRSKSG